VNEANTQSHLFNLAQSGARAPNVPEVYDVFNDGAGGTYLVTEQIPFPSFRAWVDLSSDTFAQAVAAKLNFPPSSQLNLL
jgi:hypothetical protein